MIQQYLDSYANDIIIAKYSLIWRSVKERGSVENVKSAIIGQLYGGALRLLSNLNGYEEENINPDDLKQFNELYMSRLDGIEKKIETILYKNNIYYINEFSP